MPEIARITAFTHRGRVRAHNEDTFVVGQFVSEPSMPAPHAFEEVLSAPLLCAVADGMGGHRAGEVASRLVAERLAERGAQITSADAAVAALRAVNAELYRAMAADPRQMGMGTTVVGLVLAPRLVWFNVGDSRLYRCGEALLQISIDDTPPGPRSGLLTQCLGGGAPSRAGIVPHAGEIAVETPARFLLCSDGLTDMLDDDEIAACLAAPDAEAVPELFARAMRAGGHDNITIVLVSLG
jgi:serine/threonine protein phosphatase PrpC